MNKTQLGITGIAIGLSFTSMSSLAAGDTSFLGPSIGLGVSDVRSQLEFGGVLSGQTMSKNSTGALIEASYGYPLTDDWVATAGINVDVTKYDLGDMNYTYNGSSGQVTGKLSQHWEIYVAPGYRVAPQWLVYAKFGYDQIRAQVNNSLSSYNTGDTSGWAYGLGVGYTFMPNFEARLEYMQVKYNKQQGNNATLGDAFAQGQPQTGSAILLFAYRF
jgi:long-subunit fatty acid transport protein